MSSIGIVAIDRELKWAGGRYYLQHLIRCVASLPMEERLMLRDVWWGQVPDDDPFKEVRSDLSDPVSISMPNTMWRRAVRKVKCLLDGTHDARDLFAPYDIKVFFPIPLCENTGIPYAFWLPDFQYLRRPDLLSTNQCKHFETYYHNNVYQAQRVILSSEDARNDYSFVFPEYQYKAHVVRFCSVPDDTWWKWNPIEITKKHHLPERFFIVCNQFTRHKNHFILLTAMRILLDRGMSDVHLVCTGSTFDHREEDYIGQVKEMIATHNLADNVHILGLVPRSDHIALLRQSIAALQPSMFEGWSTIIEDAKSLGKPVLTSDIPVHREQLFNMHENYLSLKDAGEWADAMAEAWITMDNGPNSEQEALGASRLNINKRECGLSFVNALRSAM